MTDYFRDSFTDPDATQIDTHTADVGGGWTHSTYDTNTLQIFSDRLTNQTFDAAHWLADTPAPTDDYIVAATVVVLNSRPFGVARIFARYEPTGDGFYFAEWDDGNQTWNLGKRVSLTETILDTSASLLADVSTQRVMELEVLGNTQLLRVDGTLVCSAADTDMPTGTTAGASTGGLVENELCLDDFVITDTAPGDPLVHIVTGRGNFAVTGLAWLSTAIDGVAVPATGQAEPSNYYHVGQLSWGTSNGALTAYPITRLLDLVQIPTGMDTVWYSLTNGVTATITELAAP